MKPSALLHKIPSIKDSTDLRDANNAIEIISAYSDCNDTEAERNLSFRAHRTVDAISLLEIMSVAVPDGYNRFDSSVVAELVEAFPEAQFTIAREGSVCIYVHMSKRLWLSRGVKQSFKADEMSIETDGSMRLWWD